MLQVSQDRDGQMRDLALWSPSQVSERGGVKREALPREQPKIRAEHARLRLLKQIVRRDYQITRARLPTPFSQQPCAAYIPSLETRADNRVVDRLLTSVFSVLVRAICMGPVKCFGRSDERRDVCAGSSCRCQQAVNTVSRYRTASVV